MLNLNMDGTFELIYVVVNYGMGTKVLQRAKAFGVKGGTVCLASGTVGNPLLNFFSLYDERKELVMIGTDSKTARGLIEDLNQCFAFKKPHHGILYSVKVCNIIGSRANTCDDNFEGESRHMYHLITTIVEKGRAADVVAASKRAGANGGTIINARGAGDKETFKIFNMEIEPEKEIVLILSKEDMSQSIIEEIKQEVDIDKPGNGIMFVQNIHTVHGLFDK